jgi:hypothetical protein
LTVGSRHFRTVRDEARAILGGWDMNAIMTMQTGKPFTPVLAASVSFTRLAYVEMRKQQGRLVFRPAAQARHQVLLPW